MAYRDGIAVSLIILHILEQMFILRQKECKTMSLALKNGEIYMKKKSGKSIKENALVSSQIYVCAFRLSLPEYKYIILTLFPFVNTSIQLSVFW